MIGYRCSNMGRTVILTNDNLFGSYIFEKNITLLRAYEEMVRFGVVQPIYGEDIREKFINHYSSAGFTKLF
jgi:hypothetical protein